MQRTFQINKLFGGSRHGKVMALNPEQHAHYVLKPLKPVGYSGSDQSLTLETSYEVYTMRKAMLGQEKLVRYWAVSTKSDAEAFDMLTNYLLRGATEL